MRLLLVLLLLGSAPTAEAASWIERSYAGLLVDAEAVVTGQVGEVSRHHAAFRIAEVLSGNPRLAGRTLSLPVVRCNEPGPDGVTFYISTCLDRTYRPGERLLLLLADYGEGLRESGYPVHSRAALTDDAVGLAESLLALPDDVAETRAAALAALLVDQRPAWRREAARAADPWLTLSSPRTDPGTAVFQRTVDLLTDPLADRLRGDPSLAVRAAAAAALGQSRRTSLSVTQALVTAAASPDEDLAYAAARSLSHRRDPRAADALLALAQEARDPDRRRSLLQALAPVVRTDHAEALEALHRRIHSDHAHDVLEVWALTGADAAADEAARGLATAGTGWEEDAGLRRLALSRDRRYARVALDRLLPVDCMGDGAFETELNAVAMLAPAEEAVPALAAYFACPEPHIRWHVVQALRQIDLPVARAALVAQWRTEDDSGLRDDLAEALGRILPEEQHP